MLIDKKLRSVINNVGFSGVVLMKEKENNLLQLAEGYADRANETPNNPGTRFGIASGCKIFTAVGICQLVEKGILSFETRLNDVLENVFPFFDETITIHHLLTHSSGVPDYFDESVMDDFEELWKERPMYLLNHLRDFLPMFQNKKMMFKPGEKFHYNNAGYILLGLIIEKMTGLSFQDYIQSHIFEPCGMKNSDYFRFDSLPENTAIGYIDNEEDGTWRTNIYSLPVRGGSDGGAYVTAQDMILFWEALCTSKLISEEYTEKLMTPHVQADENEYYGYGLWIIKKNEVIFKYHLMGYDPGVSFHSAYYPQSEITIAVTSNKSYGPFTIMEEIEKDL
ncbi:MULTISPECIES: serine hydrolase [Bacillaceae]|uniref:serine hydrolase domain-containing protein n=1 Tax=Bacillaceae TaxID=186817 RepID=UPI000BA5EB5F|nr:MULTISPECIES: serine hydrolase [Bacillaceae]PAE23761.1 penicillin-binding protein [Bacillus sp. 7894-2]URM34683.1 beta-lactamase family protein [Cytobacillus firmus]